jgi:hypothetical protein
VPVDPTTPLKSRRKFLIPRHAPVAPSSTLMGRKPIGTLLKTGRKFLIPRHAPVAFSSFLVGCGPMGTPSLSWLRSEPPRVSMRQDHRRVSRSTIPLCSILASANPLREQSFRLFKFLLSILA